MHTHMKALYSLIHFIESQPQFSFFFLALNPRYLIWIEVITNRKRKCHYFFIHVKCKLYLRLALWYNAYYIRRRVRTKYYLLLFFFFTSLAIRVIYNASCMCCMCAICVFNKDNHFFFFFPRPMRYRDFSVFFFLSSPGWWRDYIKRTQDFKRVCVSVCVCIQAPFKEIKSKTKEKKLRWRQKRFESGWTGRKEGEKQTNKPNEWRRIVSRTIYNGTFWHKQLIFSSCECNFQSLHIYCKEATEFV